jgi:Flp pilus assembly protein TadD
MSSYIGRVREISSRVAIVSSERPPEPVAGHGGIREPVLLERSNPELVQALATLAEARSAANLAAVGYAYLQLQILDRAYSHFSSAAAADRTYAPAHEGLARVWRDWGLPHVALTDAHRAVHHAPRSASARNTLGTVLQALGQIEPAMATFQHAARLDAAAAYPLNNLCYAALQVNRRERAAGWCRQALDRDPSLRTARNNLAMAIGATGTRDELLAAIGPIPPPGERELAVGLALLANGRYHEAGASFDAASSLDPVLRPRAEHAKAYVRAMSPRKVNP